MALTPETLPRHELVGLHVRVAESTDPSRVGIEGRVVRETMRTLAIERRESADRDRESVDGDGERGAAETDGVSGGQPRVVPKAGTTFEFRLTDEAAADRRTESGAASAERRRAREGAGTASEPERDERRTPGDDVAYVTVDGVTLLSRPALRTEHGVDSKWR